MEIKCFSFVEITLKSHNGSSMNICALVTSKEAFGRCDSKKLKGLSKFARERKVKNWHVCAKK